jgi:hypothetical protein
MNISYLCEKSIIEGIYPTLILCCGPVAFKFIGIERCTLLQNLRSYIEVSGPSFQF